MWWGHMCTSLMAEVQHSEPLWRWKGEPIPLTHTPGLISSNKRQAWCRDRPGMHSEFQSLASQGNNIKSFYFKIKIKRCFKKNVVFERYLIVLTSNLGSGCFDWLFSLFYSTLGLVMKVLYYWLFYCYIVVVCV